MREPPDRLTPAGMPMTPVPASVPMLPDAVLHDAQARPWRFDFYSLLRHIEARHPHRPRLGTALRPAEDPVRLAQAPELCFAPAPIARVAPDEQGRAPRITVRFFGLFGPNGPLPLHMTTYAHERALHHADPTLARFADVFHHRLLLIFYRAWAQAQPTVSADRPGDDRFANLVGALLGLDEAPGSARGEPGATAGDRAGDMAVGMAAAMAGDVPADVLRHYAGHLSGAARSAEGLAAVLAGWLRLPVEVLQFEGAWMALPPAERTRIGGAARTRDARDARDASGTRLGAGAVLGAAVWDRQHHFGLRVGPVRLATFESLLPCGPALPALASLVGFHVGDALGWHLQLELESAEVPQARLGRHARLGWSGWVGGQPHRRNARVTLHPPPHPSASRPKEHSHV